MPAQNLKDARKSIALSTHRLKIPYLESEFAIQTHLVIFMRNFVLIFQ